MPGLGLPNEHDYDPAVITWLLMVPDYTREGTLSPKIDSLHLASRGAFHVGSVSHAITVAG